MSDQVPTRKPMDRVAIMQITRMVDLGLANRRGVVLQQSGRDEFANPVYQIKLDGDAKVVYVSAAHLRGAP